MLSNKTFSKTTLLLLLTILFIVGCENIVEEDSISNASKIGNQLSVQNLTPTSLSNTLDIIVNTTLDVDDFDEPKQIDDLPGPDGLVSLREAVIAANQTPGPQIIGFNIPTSDPGFNGEVFTIYITMLIEIYDDGTIIDGSSQTLYTGNTNSAGPEIEIRGNSTPSISLMIYSAQNRIHNIIINGFHRGIVIKGEAAYENTITGCFIGVDASGSDIIANLNHGISLEDADNNRIGGLTIEERNVISGNEGQGIELKNSRFNIIQGNFIGTDATGTKVLGNGMNGVFIDWGTNDNIIGGSNPNAKNVISGNGQGVWCWGSRNTIQGNYIGTDHSGKILLGNTGGVLIASSEANENIIIGNLICAGKEQGILIYGNSNTVQENTISYNDLNGIRIDAPSVNNSISRNLIFQNAGLGIDLSGDGVSPNDPGDTDIGPNNLMNFPVLTSAKVTPGKLIVKGTIDTPNPENVTLEFFANPVPSPGGDPSGYGEGAVFLGVKKPNPKGKFTATLPTVPYGTLVTATATDVNGNTSEFAANIEVKRSKK